ncbi:hypothetical protein ACJ5NV_00365 [Loktanella agnita]|uniref:hypothetical protein n=1 Tax=Loktanella agnita TaxID=287097 RepID=UPI0039862A16
MKTPVHLWVVGVFALLWNAGGAFDYVMTQTDDTGYLAQMPTERLEMLGSAPLWFAVTWALGVWGAVLGSLLLLLRPRLAAAAFAVSLLGLIGSSVYTYGIADGGSMLAVAGPAAIAFTIAIPLILIALWLYARAMRKRGVLR